MVAVSRTSRGLLCVVIALGCLGGCGSGELSVEIAIDNLSGGAWEATGGAVDSQSFCVAGVSRWVTFLGLDGSELSFDEFADRLSIVAAAGPDWQKVIDHLLVVEYLCSDGSGSITLIEDQREPTSWRVISGRGAYAGMTGSGSIVWDTTPIGGEPLPAWIPRRISLRGELVSGDDR